jgi:integrase
VSTRRDAGIYETGPGEFRIVVSAGRKRAGGGYEQIVRRIRGTKTDARKIRDQLRADVSRRQYAPPATETNGTYLLNWLDRIKPPHGEIKMSTWKSYESHVRVHVLPDPVADERVGNTTTIDVEDFFRRLLDKGLSPATVDAVRRTWRRALNMHPKVKENPVRRAKASRVPRHEVDPELIWTGDQARRFIAYTEEHDPDMTALVRLALDTGGRESELLALAWPDVRVIPDKDGVHYTVRFHRTVSTKRLPGDERKMRFDTPKNDKARTIDIDASTYAALEAMRQRQAAEKIADVGKLVFRRPTRLGFEPWRPDVTTHLFQRLSTEAGVPRIPFHFLRHTSASWLLDAGMDVVAVSERLGHWSPSLTLTVYAHAIRGRQRELARAVGAILT